MNHVTIAEGGGTSSISQARGKGDHHIVTVLSL